VVSHTLTDIPASSPVSTSTAFPSKRRLEMFLGTEYKFLIHKVSGGENFNLYADKYNTSVEAIVTVNHNLKLPVRIGTLVVIPIGFTDVADLPAFTVYEVSQPGLSPTTLALELDISLEDLKYYNAISDTESLLAGDWLLVPHAKSTP
jgi:hypothetical protein